MRCESCEWPTEANTSNPTWMMKLSYWMKRVYRSLEKTEHESTSWRIQTSDPSVTCRKKNLISRITLASGVVSFLRKVHRRHDKTTTTTRVICIVSTPTGKSTYIVTEVPVYFNQCAFSLQNIEEGCRFTVSITLL